jgi:hypothetical protein
MGENEFLLPSSEDVRSWSAQQRASVARLLDQFSDPQPTTRRSPRRRKLVLTLGAVGTLFMMPWLVFLSMTLPAHSSGGAWRTVWVGFDAVLVAAFAATTLTVWFRRQLAAFAMVVTASLLSCDAWFDICLSWGTGEQWGSLASAAIELPLAIVLASSAATLLRRSFAVVAQLRGQDPTRVPLWRQPMIHASSTGRQDAQLR